MITLAAVIIRIFVVAFHFIRNAIALKFQLIQIKRVLCRFWLPKKKISPEQKNVSKLTNVETCENIGFRTFGGVRFMSQNN